MWSLLRLHLWAVALVATAVLLVAVPGALGAHYHRRGREGDERQQQCRRRDAESRLRRAEPPVERDDDGHQPRESEHRGGGANDYRMVTVTADVWVGVYVSADGGASWFNTFVPGFPSDNSAAGLASPLLGLDASGDPVVRFDAAGNPYVAAIAFNRDFDKGERPVDNLVYVAKYNYTPGTPAGRARPTQPPTRRTSPMPGRPWSGEVPSGSPCQAWPASSAGSPTRNGWRSTRTRPRRARAPGACTSRTRTSAPAEAAARRSCSAGRRTAGRASRSRRKCQRAVPPGRRPTRDRTSALGPMGLSTLRTPPSREEGIRSTGSRS